jgi:hypothetical protein
MNYEIENKEWSRFFGELSRYRYGWQTAIEILNLDVGGLVLTEGLPLNGITAANLDGRPGIELSVGRPAGAHQTHTIRQPVRVSLFAGAEPHRDVVSIEESDGTKTLIRFIEPRGLLLAFSEMRMAAAA